MEDFYRLNPLVPYPDDVVRVGNVSAAAATQLHHEPVANNYLQLEPDGSGSDMSDPLIKTQIANHPLYPNLVSAYIECQKVGAPSELASLLDEIGLGSHPTNACSVIGDDPELDEFMESYCDVLHRYKEELSKPFNDAISFLNNMQSELSNLCKGTLTKSSDCRSGLTSDEELSCGEAETLESRELKEMLRRKYSGYLGSLRKEFLKKRKKGKLPKDARMALLDCWNTHYRWPYPTEEEKRKLSEITGLDQKQINNWFINQRKRHWKPSEDMKFAGMEGVGEPVYYDSDGGPQFGDI
ncbi:hypothetical protein L6164_034953 [Bauhinia variegata]|uniref:Uncharacterized protein n=1 Tax=Bauhinia variegata TaxID=167791 RepID=A0ACB9KX42_BAUVA|nr:hypothetical protein L6164_034953 [Bauhinia variegata]